ncbi:MAG TPA: nuclear transport factor 2 family protein [Flavisolibacter sp.]|nr:nuclear transport factor 2 family protein [Flavisolibacter sp.]
MKTRVTWVKYFAGQNKRMASFIHLLLRLLVANLYATQLPEVPILPNLIKPKTMNIPAPAPKTDSAILSSLNAQFIRNFITQDANAHQKIIHNDFVCIESNGAIVERDSYLKNWATDFAKSSYTSFHYSEESIRLFGNIALVRAKTTYTVNTDGKQITGYTIYTDTYFKEKGYWKCVQVQITPVK